MSLKLVLVKHSLPAISAEVSADRWELSEAGQQLCIPLAERLRHCGLDRLVASPEPKAQETARLVASLLNLPVETHPSLHEHRRRTAPFSSAEQFEQDVKRLFAQPDQQVFGEETANEARERFSLAIDEILARYPHENLAIIAHGTVISLFVAQACRLDGLELWKRLGLPAFIALHREPADGGQSVYQLETLENITRSESST